MIIPMLKEMLMHLQLVPIQETPSTKRQHVDETPDIVQPEPKRARTEVNRSPIGKKGDSTKMRSGRTIRHETKNLFLLVKLEMEVEIWKFNCCGMGIGTGAKGNCRQAPSSDRNKSLLCALCPS